MFESDWSNVVSFSITASLTVVQFLHPRARSNMLPLVYSTYIYLKRVIADIVNISVRTRLFNIDARRQVSSDEIYFCLIYL